eukprot:4101730-Pleurochrysis_carterae.AAC.1
MRTLHRLNSPKRSRPCLSFASAQIRRTETVMDWDKTPVASQEAMEEKVGRKEAEDEEEVMMGVEGAEI